MIVPEVAKAKGFRVASIKHEDQLGFMFLADYKAETSVTKRLGLLKNRSYN